MPIRLHDNLEEAPPEKRIRFYEVHDKLHNQFNVSATHTAKVLKAAFPQTERKRVGREKHSYYTRITWKARPVSSHPQPPPQLVGASPSSLPLGLVPVTQPPPEPPSAVAQLLARNYELESRVKHLEERMEKMVSAAQIEQEVASLVQSEGQVVYGPDTPEHFQSFSLDQVSREVQSGAPTLYGLMQMICDTSRNAQDDGGTTVEETKALVSCCILLNSRSQRVSGIQLLMSLMMVARGISKQVCIIIYTQLAPHY